MEEKEIEETGKIIQVNIEEQMKTAYIDYSMSVIVSRALPDVRDGMKPVHRRILYAMNDLGMRAGTPHKKSARIVGEVLAKYHPHGDSAVYDAMVRMAQPWSLRYPMVDGQGNFGSQDQDSPAAMRYTEARMQKITEEVLMDINKETVDFQNNFDDTLQEPVVLPTRIPNLLVNGSSGIAVGMATNMAPHNLSEVIEGIVAYVDNDQITSEELMQYVKAPDFPTGGMIYGYQGVIDAFTTGRGRVVMRADSLIEMDEKHGCDQIIFSSVPYQVNKSELVSRIADLVNEHHIDGIADVRDESTSQVRVVIDLKKDAVANVVLNKLYQMTPLQTSFSINNIALVKGHPMMLTLRDLIKYFVEHRHEVVVRRTQFELRKAEERAHILEGLIKAIDIIDEIIAAIKASKTSAAAQLALIEKWDFSEIQAKAIVDMRLAQLTGLAIENLNNEYNELMAFIARCNEILNNIDVRKQIIKDEMMEVKEKYGDARRSKIVYDAADFRIEDMIANEEVVITISHMGYIKRTNLSEYHRQSRGGKGAKGSDVRDADFLEHLFVASMHNYMLFFTEKGKCYWMRVFEIAEGTRQSKGRAIQNMINIEPDDKVRAYINVKDLKDPEYLANNYIILCTKDGIIKKTSLEAYSRPRQSGIIALTVREGDQLLEARLTNGSNEVILALKSGKALRFNESKVRPMGRSASGVKGITKQHDEDQVIGMICIDTPEYDILVVSENGYGKRSKLDDYRETNRGGKGVKTISITDKTGALIAIKNVLDSDDLMIINKSGIILRMAVSDLRVVGRATQGVKLINLKGKDAIASVTQVPHGEDDEDEIIEKAELADGTEVIEDTPEDTPEDNNDPNNE